MAAGAAPGEEQPITLSFDRPFLFAVRETATGAILFQGRVTDPSATR
jgi:serpin B